MDQTTAPAGITKSVGQMVGDLEDHLEHVRASASGLKMQVWRGAGWTAAPTEACRESDLGNSLTAIQGITMTGPLYPLVYSPVQVDLQICTGDEADMYILDQAVAPTRKHSH